MNKSNKFVIISITLLVISISTFGQLKQERPENEGFSSQRLKKIDSLLKKETVTDKNFGGAVALIARNGKIVYHHAEGYRDVEKQIPLQKSDLFRIASQTKAITAAAVMILFEEGRFLLDDPISNYIPEFKDPKVIESFDLEDTTYTTIPANREITIHDLLTHTAGIGYAQIGDERSRALYASKDIPGGFESRPVTLKEKITELAALPLLHQPGEAFTYGLSSDVLGYFVEVISDMPFNDFLKERIFDPLGMEDTYFYVPKDKQNRLSKIHRKEKDGELKVFDPEDSTGIHSSYPLSDKGSYYSGGAGLISTAKDYAAFLQMLLDGGIYNEKRILSPFTVKLMTKKQVPNGKKLKGWEKEDDLGFTFQVVTEDGGGLSFLMQPGSYYWGGYWGSSYWVDPETHLVAQIWTQHAEGSSAEMSLKFWNLVYYALVQE